jgi:YVTN family beta-propeller protein
MNLGLACFRSVTWGWENGFVWVIDVAEREVVNTIQVGRLPWGVLTTPE